MHQAQENSIVCQLIPIHNLKRGHPLREKFWELYNHPENNIFMYWETRSQEELLNLKKTLRPQNTYNILAGKKLIILK